MSAKRILVGIDDSPEAQKALDFAIDLGQSLNAQVIACHVIGKLPRTTDGRVISLQTYRASIIRAFEEEWCRSLDESGLHTQKIIVDGNPVASLLTITDEEKADLVILGSRRHTLDSYLGSTSHQLIEHSPVPVVVVPPKSS
ncbi:MAG: universal stress protein [Acidimicrobiaceae bacterium]|nr:universal stress protein [Acidimicrobiaceae bacterium]